MSFGSDPSGPLRDRFRPAGTFLRPSFENWRNDIVIPAHSSKTVAFDVWYDVPTTAPTSRMT